MNQEDFLSFISFLIFTLSYCLYLLFLFFLNFFISFFFCFLFLFRIGRILMHYFFRPFSPFIERVQRNWVFATNLNFLIPISLQFDKVHIWYFKLILFNIKAFIVWNIKYVLHQIVNIYELKYQSLWQRLNSFALTMKI